MESEYILYHIHLNQEGKSTDVAPWLSLVVTFDIIPPTRCVAALIIKSALKSSFALERQFINFVPPLCIAH